MKRVLSAAAAGLLLMLSLAPVSAQAAPQGAGLATDSARIAHSNLLEPAAHRHHWRRWHHRHNSWRPRHCHWDCTCWRDRWGDQHCQVERVCRPHGY